MSEKLKTQQRDNELERLAHELEMKVLNQESTQQAEPEAPDNRCLHTVWSSHSVTFEGNKTRNEFSVVNSSRLCAAGSRCWNQS